MNSNKPTATMNKNDQNAIINNEAPVVVPIKEVIEYIKSGKWIFYISDQNPKVTDKSTQYASIIADGKTKKEIYEGNYIIKATATIKNGPFIDKGQSIPKDVITAQREGRTMCKLEITYGSKSSGPLGELQELLFLRQSNGKMLFHEAILDCCNRLKIDTEGGNIIVPFPPLKTTYGSQQKPGDPVKKAQYMQAADWKFGPAIRCNTKTLQIFGFDTFIFEKSQSGIKPKKINITANNVCDYFRYKYETILLFKPGPVTVVIENTLHKFYCSFIDVESFYIKPTSKKVTYHHAIDAGEMEEMACDNDTNHSAGDDGQHNDGGSNDDNDAANIGGPQSADDIQKQLKHMAM